MIIGLAGTFASGKDTLADWVEQHGFYHVSTSDMVREGCQQEYGSTDRKDLYEYANETRSKEGAGIFVQKALEQAKDQKKVVITGIRSIGEVEVLQAAGGKLIFVDAPIELRYERAFKRGRDEEIESFEKFKASEEKELHRPTQNKTEQNIGAIKDMADTVLINDSDLNTFFTEAAQTLEIQSK